MRLLILALAATAVAAGGFTRCYDLGGTSFTHDEIVALTGWRATPLTQGDAESPASRLGALTARWLTYDARPLRSFSAVSGCLALIAFWWLGSLVLGRAGAAVATTGFAWSATQIWWSRHLSLTSFETLLALLTAGFCVRAISKPAPSPVWGGVCVCAAVYGWTSATAACLVVVLLVVGLQMDVATEQRHSGRLLIIGGLLFSLVLNVWQFGPWPNLTLLSGAWTWTQAVTLEGTLDATVSIWLLPLVLVGIIRSRPREHHVLLVGWGAVSLTAWILARSMSRAATHYAHAAEPALWMLGGAGAIGICEWVERRLGRNWELGVGLGLLALFTLPQLPSAKRALSAADPDWRQITQIVRTNWRSGEPIVVLHDRDAFLFYAPELADRVEPVSAPVRALPALSNGPHAWLVVPFAARVYPGWPAVEEWLGRFAAVDLSPDRSSASVYYVGRYGRNDLLRRAEFFELPASSLTQGSLMFDLLQRPGSSTPALWKVDQLVRSTSPPALRNPNLLNAVYLLAEHKQGDRAASLAYRLASADPGWLEAQRALAAFRAPEGG